MNCDFDIRDGIYLCQAPHELDLHNKFDFHSLDYSVQTRVLSLYWQRSGGDWVPAGTPASVCIEFRDVSEFRFLPRDAEMPFIEDDCVNTIGYWTDEQWADGVIMTGPGQHPDPSWLTAICFMSGAVIAVQAETAHARVAA